MYIPAGAILGEDQVEVSFRLVTEEGKIRRFLAKSSFEGSILCSGVFQFEAKYVRAQEGAQFDAFLCDVWIELPHCLSFTKGSLKDYSSAVVVSDSRGEVGVETQALFSEGYPYVNFPVHHFSRFCVSHSPKKRFTWSAKHHPGKANASKRVHSVSKLFSDLQRLSLSSGNDSGDSPISIESPIARGNHFQRAASQSAMFATYSPPDRRALLAEVKATTSRSFEQPARLELVRQQSLDLDDDMMDIDAPGVQEPNDSRISRDQELLHGASMSLYACVYQPMNRHTLKEWMADIVFIPLLPQALNVSHRSHLHMCMSSLSHSPSTD